MFAGQQHLEIYASLVIMVCDGLKFRKYGISRIDGNIFKLMNFLIILKSVKYMETQNCKIR